MNIFNNINYSGLQTLFTDAITSMIDSSACTVPCTLTYGDTRYEDCINCVYDPIGRKSANTYQAGGPIPFHFGTICPMCGGNGKRPVESTEDIEVLLVYNPKDFINFDMSVNINDGYIQTMAKVDMMSQFRRAKTIKVSTDIDGHFTRTYERVQEPTPCGFGNSAFAVCTWKRI